MGGANSRRWGRAGPSRRRLAQPAPGLAGYIFKITGPSPTTSVRFQSHATSARPSQRVYNLTDWSSARPGLWDSQNVFAVSSCCCVSSSSRFRGSNVLVSPGPAASLGSRSLSTTGVRSRVCHAPIPAFVYRWCGVGYIVPWSGIYISSHDKMSRMINRDFIFFLGKS